MEGRLLGVAIRKVEGSGTGRGPLAVLWDVALLAPDESDVVVGACG